MTLHFSSAYDQVLRRFEQLTEKNGNLVPSRFPEMLDRPSRTSPPSFALHRSLPIYSGGLGVLAGDHSRKGPTRRGRLVGVGLYYHGGYFDQQIGLDGWQRDSDRPVDPTVNPVVRVHGADGVPASSR